MAARLAQAAAALVLLAAALAVALYWVTERMNIDGIGPACAAMASC